MHLPALALAASACAVCFAAPEHRADGSWEKYYRTCVLMSRAQVSSGHRKGVILGEGQATERRGQGDPGNRSGTWGIVKGVDDPLSRYEDAIRRVAVLHAATPDDVREIAGLAIERAVEAGGYFFMQGEKAEYLYILVRGRAKLCTISTDGQQVNLRTLAPNQLFGALGAVEPGATYPACAQAMEDSTSLAISSEAFRQMLKHRPHLSFGLMRLMTGYIQEMQERYGELATKRVDQRIGLALLRLAAQSGSRDVENGITLPFSNQDLAEMAGTTLYTVSRCLSDWQKRGIIDTGRGRVTLLAPHELVRIAEDLTD
jgi:CRP-like cAMP-binding protein